MSKDKLTRALKLLNEGQSMTEVASQLGTTQPALGQLIRRRGYKFDKTTKTYAKADTENDIEAPHGSGPYQLSLTSDAVELLQRAEEFLNLLDAGKGSLADTLSSPLLKGPKVTKGFRLPIELDHKLELYAAEMRFTQQDVFCAALVEFLQRRGGKYAAQ